MGKGHGVCFAFMIEGGILWVIDFKALAKCKWLYNSILEMVIGICPTLSVVCV